MGALADCEVVCISQAKPQQHYRKRRQARRMIHSASLPLCRGAARCYLDRLVNHHGRNTVVPCMASTIWQVPQIPDAAGYPGASAPEIPVIEDADARPAEYLDRRDVIAKISRKCRKLVPAPNTELVPLKRSSSVETRTTARIGSLIPAGIPCIVPLIDPGIRIGPVGWSMWILRDCGYCEA